MSGFTVWRFTVNSRFSIHDWGESCDCRSEMRFRGVPELDDQRMVLERVLHDAALYPFAATVDQAHFAQAGIVRGANVLGHDRRNVSRREGVKIERIRDRNAMTQSAWNVDVTTVLMPPRTLKSPTTVMRRGEQAATRSSRIWLVTAS